MYLSCILPMLLLLILIWSYYVYIVEFTVHTVTSMWQRILFIVVCHLFFVPLIWSFLDIVATSPDEVPEKYKLTDAEHESFLTHRREEDADRFLHSIARSRHLVFYTCTSQSRIRYCMDCKHIKPDRTHHCTACNTCVLRMDHHCPWINNCAGFHNYKSFVLFLFYVTLYIGLLVGTLMPEFLSYWDPITTFSGTRLHIVIGFTTALLIGILSTFFFIYHLTLLFKNETTVERIYPPFLFQSITFDLGWTRNFKEVFGDNCLLWFFPVFSSLGSGDEFDVVRVENI